MVELTYAFTGGCFPSTAKLQFHVPSLFIHRRLKSSGGCNSRPVRMAGNDIDPRGNNLEKYSALVNQPATAIGDSTVFFIFAAIGRMNHASSEGSIFLTAAPFVVSWLAIAPLLNGFQEAESRPQAVTSIFLPLAATVPCAILLRGLIQGYIPAPSFWAVAFVATSLLLTIWRLIYFQYSVASSTVDKFVEAILDDDD